MAREYEFLVAGLPELLLEDSKGVPPFRAFISAVEESVLAEKDLAVVNAMRLPIDNRNFVNMLDSKEEFDDRGCFSREDLEESVRSPDALPKYMRKYLEARKENKPLFPGLTEIDQLSWLFYDEMAESPNAFLRDWFAFDLDLRNVIAGINIRKELHHIEALATERDRPGVFTIINTGTAAESVQKSAAPDFGLSGEYPWIEKVLSLTRGNQTDTEKGLDDLRWETLNDLTVTSYCQIESVAAFLQKLLIVERWTKLNPEIGKGKLDKLIGELMESFVMPEGF